MTLEEAKQIVLNEDGDPMTLRVLEATGVLGANENKDKVSLQELLAWLRRGHRGNRPTLIAEYAAIALYKRTGRRRRSESPMDFILDPNDWAAYLESQA